MYWQGETYTFCSPFRPKVLASGGNPKLPHFTHQPAIEPPNPVNPVMSCHVMSIQFPYIVQSQSQQSGVNPVSYIVQSRSQQSVVNPVSLYCTELVSAVWCQSRFVILCRVGLSSLVSILFPYVVQSRSQQSGVNPVSYIVQSRSQQSVVNPVSLYCTELVSAVWCQSRFVILCRVGLSSLVSIQFPYIVQSRSQ